MRGGAVEGWKKEKVEGLRFFLEEFVGKKKSLDFFFFLSGPSPLSLPLS
jgi:hypothetical protein